MLQFPLLQSVASVWKHSGTLSAESTMHFNPKVAQSDPNHDLIFESPVVSSVSRECACNVSLSAKVSSASIKPLHLSERGHQKHGAISPASKFAWSSTLVLIWAFRFREKQTRVQHSGGICRHQGPMGPSDHFSRKSKTPTSWQQRCSASSPHPPGASPSTYPLQRLEHWRS